MRGEKYYLVFGGLGTGVESASSLKVSVSYKKESASSLGVSVLY